MWREFFIATVFCYAYFFYPMSKKIIYCYYITIDISIFIWFFFNFYRETNMDTVWVNIVVFSEHNLKVKPFPCLCKRDEQLSLLCLYDTRNARSSIPGLYFANSASYFPKSMRFLIFCTFSLASLQFCLLQ